MTQSPDEMFSIWKREGGSKNKKIKKKEKRKKSIVYSVSHQYGIYN